MSEKRVQERRECPFDDVNLGDECHLSSFLPTCRNCNNDGTRWVTVGTLIADEDTDSSYLIQQSLPPQEHA